ncbi:MAG: hypothetical protein C0493_12780 [Kytococcus sp.]|nr:hypothetical protein [Kytococcus sp.]
MAFQELGPGGEDLFLAVAWVGGEQAADPPAEEQVEGEPDLDRVVDDVGATDLRKLVVDALLGWDQLGSQVWV